MDVFTKFRDEVRERVGEGPKGIMEACDKVRDDVLPFLGIRLEDKPKGEPSLWKYDDKEVLIAEREKKIEEKKKKEEEKLKRKMEEEKLMSTPPEEYFKIYHADKYSQFNEQGIPTHSKGKDGKEQELNEKTKKKLQKDFDKQKDKHEKWRAVKTEEKKD